MKTYATITIVAFSCAILAAPAAADTVQATLTFSEDDLVFSEITEGETTYDVVKYGDKNVLYNVPGKPQLPLMGYSFSIPFGSTVTAVEITSYTSEPVEGDYYLYPGQLPRITGYGDPVDPSDYEWVFTDPDTYIYALEEPFPENILVDAGAGESRGHLMADFNLFPLQWTPAAEELTLYTSVTVRVTYTPPDPAPEAERHEWPDIHYRWWEMIQEQVLNPDDVFANREPVNYVDVMEWGTETENGEEIPWVKPAESEYYEYNLPHEVEEFPQHGEPCYPFPFIVITNEKWWYGEDPDDDYIPQGDVWGALQDFYNWKMRKGEPLHIVMVDDIVDNWEGTDKQDKIRNWMKDVSDDWGTQAFLLAGDTAAPPGNYKGTWDKWGRYGVVPSRYLYREGYDHWVHVSDLYYTCLEGDWEPELVEENSDIVGYWGTEGSQPASFHPTVFVGRVPIGDVDPPGEPGATTQAEIEAGNYCAKLIKYETDPPSGYVNDVLLVGSDFGAHAPYYHCQQIKNEYFSSWSTTEVYEPEVRYPNYPRPHHIYDALADGPAISFFATHGHPLCHYSLTHGVGWGPGVYIQEFTVDEGVPITNDMVFAHGLKEVNAGGKYGLHFADACSTFKYDWRNAESEECLGEEFLCDDYGGGVAYVGNTCPGTGGCLQIAKDYLFDYLLNKGMYDVGRAVAKARTDYIKNNPYGHYSSYVLNLGGDPTMELWTAEPAPLNIDYEWWANGTMKTLRVKVTTTGGQAVPGAKVCLWQMMYYLTTTTGTDGRCTFKDLLFGFDDGKLTATKHNYKPALLDNVTIGE